MTTASNPQLLAKINQAIANEPQRVLPFSDFMNMALYEPGVGYYAAKCSQLGPEGDFVTSPHLCADFGELIALQMYEFWQVLGQPSQFTVVEMGAGQGLISVDALRFFLRHYQGDPFLDAIQWKLIETSSTLIRWQKKYFNHRIQPLLASLNVEIDIQWTSLEELESEPIVGCFFSNELVDAFPIHWLEVKNSSFCELGVQISGEEAKEFDLTFIPLSLEVKQHLSALNIRPEGLPSGYRCEVNVQAQDWMASVAASLQKGFVLTIDYGYSQQQLYSPARHEGTLQCYFQQKSHHNPLIHVGNQDITSHVNFSALEHFGSQNDLEKLALTHQGLFLMALGLGDRLHANNSQTDMSHINEALQRREALHALMNPMGLGGFKVLLQGKGLDPQQRNYDFLGFKDAMPGAIL